MSISTAIATVVAGGALSRDQAADAMSDIMQGRATPAQFGAFVTALHMKGETADELAGMADVMRAMSVRVPTDLPVVDTCGTGGDGSGSFNVSTAAAFVVAGAGVPVAKHGNRGMTSKCGSADVLEALGVKVVLGPDSVARCIEQAGMGFMFAPAFHPAMKFAAPLRRELGIRTIFNILGPLTNPAGAARQVIGVATGATQPTMAGALVQLGAIRTLVVHGDGGLDEISLSGATQVFDVDGSTIAAYEIHPSSFGIPLAHPNAIAGGDATHNAQLIHEVLNETDRKDRSALSSDSASRYDIVCMNAGAALLAGGRVATFADGVHLARETIATGAARDVLAHLVALSQTLT